MSNGEGSGQRPGGGQGLGRGGRGRQPGGYGLGPEGFCVCTNPECRHKVPHQRGIPCYTLKCERCGSPMTRGE